MAFLNHYKVSNLNLLSVGMNVLISDKASIYGAERITIGNNVRIDDFCILSAGMEGIFIGNYVHIACFSSLIGEKEIRIDDYANISSRVSIYSSSDDYSGNSMTNPMIQNLYKQVDNRRVAIKKHCIIGAGSIILPGVTLGEGCAIGALSLVKDDCEEFGIYTGIPVKKKGQRSKRILEIENNLKKNDN